MTALIQHTSERLLPDRARRSKEAFLVYLRHLFAYEAVPQFFNKTQTLVEVGCGEGYGASLLAQAGFSIIGLDVDPQVAQYASDKYAATGCRFRVSRENHLPMADESVDGVISFQVLEHVQDEIAFLREIHRILKKDATCLFTTPNKTSRVKPGHAPWNRFHLREYTPTECQELLQRVFSSVEVRGIHGTPEIQAVEQARVKQIQKFVDIDRLRLRRFLSPALETRLVTLLKKILKTQYRVAPDTEYLTRYSVQDYRIMQEHVEDSLDLLAICRK